MGTPPPNVDNVLTERFITRDKPLRITNELLLLSDHHCELLYPVCPSCGADRVTKQEFRRRTPILGAYGPPKLYLRCYRCTVCGKKFTTPLSAVVAPYHRYASVFEGTAARMIQTGYRSLRKLKEDLSTAFSIGPRTRRFGTGWRFAKRTEFKVLRPGTQGTIATMSNILS